MHSFVTSLPFLLTFLLSVTAQTYNVQSPPFWLVLISNDATWQGRFLTTCHEGAAIEALCWLEDTSVTDGVNGADGQTTFGFNTSSTGTHDLNSAIYGVPGVLTWNLIFNGGPQFVSEAMSFVVPNGNGTETITDYTVPMLEPSMASAVQVAFDDNNFLNIQSVFANPNVTGIAASSSGNQAHYRWYMCYTFDGLGDYTYWTLAWSKKESAPIEPSCVPVQVYRLFVPQAGQPM